MFNALQPGVFALSGWDLSGMLTVDAAEVADLIADGDTRWINRGAHDLRGVDEPAREGRMPAARSLYGTLPDQLADPDSFASRLRRDHRHPQRAAGIATAVQVDVPDVSHRAELVLVHRLADETLQVTVLNFSGEEISGSVRSEHLPAGRDRHRHVHGRAGRDRGRSAQLRRWCSAPYQGTSLLSGSVGVAGSSGGRRTGFSVSSAVTGGRGPPLSAASAALILAASSSAGASSASRSSRRAPALGDRVVCHGPDSTRGLDENACC